jgi:hypothetical protein
MFKVSIYDVYRQGDVPGGLKDKFKIILSGFLFQFVSDLDQQFVCR